MLLVVGTNQGEDEMKAYERWNDSKNKHLALVDKESRPVRPRRDQSIKAWDQAIEEARERVRRWRGVNA